MTVLFIDEEKRAEIAKVIAEARAHVVPWDIGRQIMVDERDKPVSVLSLDQRPKADVLRPLTRRVSFVGGVEAALSFEEQPAGILRHLSVSTGKKGRTLNPTMFAALAAEFGFAEVPPTYGRMWLEEYEPGFYAVNIVEIEVHREAGHA